MLRIVLGLWLLIFPSAACAQWMEARSKHFVVYSKGNEAEFRSYVESLERFDQGMRVLRNIPDDEAYPANRLTLFVLDSQSDVGRLHGSPWVYGFYVPRGTGAVAYSFRYERRTHHRRGRAPVDLRAQEVLFHEYTHHVMLSGYANAVYPSWYVEGFAEFHATADVGDDGSVTFGAVPQYRNFGASAWTLPVARLVADDIPSDGISVEGLYGRGWLLTHYLNFAAQRKDQLAAYLTAVNNGRTPAEAAAEFGSLSVLESELRGYYNANRFETLRVDPVAIRPGPIEIRRLSAAESELMSVRIRSKRGVTPASAKGIYADARRAERYPDDAGAQIILAEAAYDAREFAAAEAAADRAFAADPTMVDAVLYKAMAQSAAAVAAGDTSEPRWAAIRRVIATANRLDPNDPEPLALYHQSYVDQGFAPTEIARDGMIRAFELAPYDRSYRLTAAQILLQDRNLPVARRLLMVLTSDRHRKPQADRARDVVALIDEGKPEEALAKLRTPIEPQ